MTPSVRKVIAEHVEDGWLTMDDRGDIVLYASPQAVLRSVKRTDARALSGFAVTVIEWRNVPEGFTAPDLDIDKVESVESLA